MGMAVAREYFGVDLRRQSIASASKQSGGRGRGSLLVVEGTSAAPLSWHFQQCNASLPDRRASRCMTNALGDSHSFQICVSQHFQISRLHRDRQNWADVYRLSRTCGRSDAASEALAGWRLPARIY